jgi:hypothetical protein
MDQLYNTKDEWRRSFIQGREIEYLRESVEDLELAEDVEDESVPLLRPMPDKQNP